MKYKVNKILEYVWLVIMIGAFVMFFVVYYYHGWELAKPMAYLFPFSVLFYLMRRKRSKNLKEEEV